jgi:bleomycin hydrolase
MNIKGVCSFFILLLGVNLLFAQPLSDKDSSLGYSFEPVLDLATTTIKDQYKSSTCWSFSSMSFIESEVLRMGGPQLDLSEMFVVWNCYRAKADRYVRMHGNTNFGPGGAFHDAFWVIKNYGIVPEEVYKGLTIGNDKPVHGEMDDALKSYVDGIVKNKNKKLSPVWYSTFTDMLNNYLGVVPDKFSYNGKEYSPKSFATDVVKINPDDYVEIGSYTHHPFYSKFVLEIPDNWLWSEIYNVPVAEITEIIDYALANGYTVAWGVDISDKGFATKTKGVAVVPDVDYTTMSDSDIARWQGLDEDKQQEELFKFEKPGKEKTITQEMRQTDFDNYTSTDDHGMHIVGTAKDQNGTVYYKVKNSWGNYNAFKGYFYVSKPYVALRTIDFMVHKNGIPKHIRTKLGL